MKQIRIIVFLLSVASLFVVIANASASGAPSVATPAHGEFAAAIRSAGLPCSHVVDVESLGESAWHVRCNAGEYRVDRSAEGTLSVVRP